MALTQENRLIAIDTPLGKDVLLLRGFTGQEGISKPYIFELDLLSDDPDIKFEDIIGQRVTLSVAMEKDEERVFNGFINRFVQSGRDKRFTHYRATMVPWLWFLTRTSNCRIFFEKDDKKIKITDIITKVFDDRGYSGHYEVRCTSASPAEREYCVQYRETDFNFVSRLMEQYGIFYFFEHDDNGHKLILADGTSAHKPCPGQATARWEPQGRTKLEEEVISSLQMEKEFRTGKYALTDYNFETPSTSLASEVKTTISVGENEKYEFYDYPGEYGNKGEGESVVKLRMEEEEAQHFTVMGTSNCRAFTSGYRFKLEEHFRDDLNNKDFVLTEVQHSGTVGDAYISGDDAEQDYSNSFSCLPHKVPFRPSQVTPKPVIQGPQTALVVGPKGEEIYVDNYSRVKVQFHWDREGQKDENSSCWVRVSQNWAGKQWGAIFIPRIGQEVIVEFLEGDPDRPIITGRVYNAELMPPYELPANMTQSGLKTRSSKAGSTENFNEIRFEDKKGEEELYIHAERDKTVQVERDRTEKVGRNETISIHDNRTESVGKDESVSIKQNRTLSVGKDEQISIGDNRTEEVGKKETVTITGDREHNVGKNDTLQVGKELYVEAADLITFKTGSASIVMKSNGDIQIKGNNITTTGSGKVNLKASSDVIIKGSTVKKN